MSASDNAVSIVALQASIAKLASDNQNYWLIWAGVLVFSIQLGFLCLEVGTVRIKNTRNILIKNMMDTAMVSLFYWGFGYAFAYGQSQAQDSKKSAGFIGDTLYFYSANPENLHANFAGYGHMFFNYALAGVASSIVSGAMAERSHLATYFLYSAFLGGFVYPVVSHWVWATPGWLCAWHEFKGETDLYMDVGAIDFGGSGVVHLTGAVAAAWGAWWLGPRRGRFINGIAQHQHNHSQPMQVMGAFMVWAGWYAMNIGHAFTMGTSSAAAGRIAITTTLSAAGGAITSMIIGFQLEGDYNLDFIMNGAMSGLVAISSGCAVVAPWAALVIGIIAAFVFHGGHWLTLHFMKIDDVTKAVAVHGWNGIWGCVATGLFARQEEVFEVFGTKEQGLFYGGSNILGTNITFVCVTVCWVSFWMCGFFGACHYAGCLRLSEKEEDVILEGIELSRGDQNNNELVPDVEGDLDLADTYQSTKEMVGAPSIDPRV
jgi:Amt family ammonium transporter